MRGLRCLLWMIETTMKDTELDAIILSHVGNQWLKVARIAGDILRAPELEILVAKKGLDRALDVIVARVQALAQAGIIEAQGNLSYPRYSEIRRP